MNLLCILGIHDWDKIEHYIPESEYDNILLGYGMMPGVHRFTTDLSSYRRSGRPIECKKRCKRCNKVKTWIQK